MSPLPRDSDRVMARERQPCGTYRAYHRQIRNDEDPDPLCKAANAEYELTSPVPVPPPVKPQAVPDVQPGLFDLEVAA